MVPDRAGGRCGEAALTGLLGRLGPFYPAGPRAPPTLRARRRPRPRAALEEAGAPPRVPPPALRAPPPPAGRLARVATCQAA